MLLAVTLCGSLCLLGQYCRDVIIRGTASLCSCPTLSAELVKRQLPHLHVHEKSNESCPIHLAMCSLSVALVSPLHWCNRHPNHARHVMP